MERARATWTDERLDDLSRRVDHGFSEVHADLRALNAHLDARFDLQERRFDRLDARIDLHERRFDRMDARIDSLQRLMIQIGAATTVAILATLITVIATRG